MTAQADLMGAAQRAAGVLAARQRGDHEGAGALLTGFRDAEELAHGALLLAHLSLGLSARESERGYDEVVQELCVQLEAAVGR